MDVLFILYQDVSSLKWTNAINLARNNISAITNEENNIIQVLELRAVRDIPSDKHYIKIMCYVVILLTFMSDIFLLYMSDEGYFTFIFHHFVRFMI